MSSHFENLKYYIPDLGSRSILDVGSGRGKFLISAVKAGARAVGVEPFEHYIKLSHERAKEVGVKINVAHGVAEKLPFKDADFDFVNLSEVLEHVGSPKKVITEVYRVLKPEGYAYASIPNRFGIFDPHFHLLFLNWMPRSLAEKYIGIFDRHKLYEEDNGKQRISEMYYDSFWGARRFLSNLGFSVTDMRLYKLNKKYWYGAILIPLYLILRLFYFDSFHFLLKKTSQ